MGTGVLFAVLATLCGVAINRALRAPLSVAPFSGLAAIAVFTAWCAGLGAPGLVSTGGVVLLALAGAVFAYQQARGLKPSAIDRPTIALLATAVTLPALLLGAAMARIDTPVSTHDGAFHVETADSLRRGVPVQGWYPMAFHTSVAAVLRLLPWVDTARGTADAAQALAILAPLGVFALGLALGLSRRLASVGALILALTYIYPYDDHLWGGYPLATSILLLLGLWRVRRSRRGHARCARITSTRGHARYQMIRLGCRRGRRSSERRDYRRFTPLATRRSSRCGCPAPRSNCAH